MAGGVCGKRQKQCKGLGAICVMIICEGWEGGAFSMMTPVKTKTTYIMWPERKKNMA